MKWNFKSLPTQNILSKFLVNPEVDEKVSEVVDIDQVKSVVREVQVAGCRKYDARVAKDGQSEEADSNFDRFLVAFSLVVETVRNTQFVAIIHSKSSSCT